MDLHQEIQKKFYGMQKQSNPSLLSDQREVLGLLSTLFSRESLEQDLKNQIIFVMPGAKSFFLKFIDSLDPSLEPKANEVFQRGLSYISEFMGNRHALNIVNSLLDRLSKQFPSIKESYEQQLNDFIGNFFRPTIGEFLDARQESVNRFAREFPLIHELFVSPLKESPTYKSKKLFKFYCNPCIYSNLARSIAEPDYNLPLLRRLEYFLRVVQLHTSDESWKVLSNKVQELLKSSENLETFTWQCLGLFGEIQTAAYLIKNMCQRGDLVNFLEGDNRTGKQVKKQNCDLMIVFSSGQDSSLSPRYGVEGSNSGGKWNDFIRNFSPPISSYLQYLDSTTSVFNMSIKKCYPLFWASEGCSYGIASPNIRNVIQTQSSDDVTGSETNSEKKIEILLKAWFLKPLVLHQGCAPLATKGSPLPERILKTERVVQKGWVSNTMQKGVAQLRTSYKFQTEAGHSVSKLYLTLFLILPFELLRDPFNQTDGDIKQSFPKLLNEVFQPFKEELSKEGLNIELLLLSDFELTRVAD